MQDEIVNKSTNIQISVCDFMKIKQKKNSRLGDYCMFRQLSVIISLLLNYEVTDM